MGHGHRSDCCLLNEVWERTGHGPLTLLLTNCLALLTFFAYADCVPAAALIEDQPQPGHDGDVHTQRRRLPPGMVNTTLSWNRKDDIERMYLLQTLQVFFTEY